MNTQRRFDLDLPIVLGFAGGYCTGKTTTANGIAPPARMQFRGDDNNGRVLWDHLYFALPLYRMATARQSIEGDDAHDRVLYEIHATLLEVFANNPLYGAPKYDDLVQMVYEIAEYPCPKDSKPRSFLQHVGTEIVRAYDDDAWVKWMDRKIKEEHRSFEWEHREVYCETCGTANPDYVAPYYGVVVSDCRFENEARLIAEHPNGILINFTVDPEVAAARQYERDGYRMNGEQKSHKSEQQFNSIPEEWYTKTIDTTSMTPKEQIAAVKSLVTDLTGLPT